LGESWQQAIVLSLSHLHSSLFVNTIITVVGGSLPWVAMILALVKVIAILFTDSSHHSLHPPMAAFRKRCPSFQ
jgi:hypothetical protein